MNNQNKPLVTTRIVLAVGFVISIISSLGLIASGWVGYATFTVPLVIGFLMSLLASFLLKGKNSINIVWTVLIVVILLSFLIIWTTGPLAM
jgi:hypothetical protein